MLPHRLAACCAVFAIAPVIFAQPSAAPGYHLQRLVPSSPFCGVHGLGVDANDRLYAGSVVGQRLYAVNTDDGAVTVRIEPPRGMADDMEFLSDGTLVWTSISQNAVRAQLPDGTQRDLASDLRSVNSIAYREKDNRLFVAQVFGGDGLWELDPTGDKPRRRILQDLGGLNGFDIGPDGMIYGPLWFRNRVVKIDPDSGAMTTVADGFHTPAAANFDSQWNLYVLDTATGEIFKVDIETGNKEVFVTLKPALDNLAIDSKDTIYVSNMADNSIRAIDSKTKAIRIIVPEGLSCASGISVATENGRDTLYIADVFALRKADGDTGQLTDIARSHAADTPIGYVSAVAAGKNHFYVNTSGHWQRYDRNTEQRLDDWTALRGVQALIELHDGDLLTLGNDGRSLSRINPANINQRHVITEQLNGVAAMVQADDNTIYASVPSENRVVAVKLDSGEVSTAMDNIEEPRGIGMTKNGVLMVMKSKSGDVVALNITSGDRHRVATGLPVGRLGATAGTQLPALAVGHEGAVYVIADGENSVYKITAQ